MALYMISFISYGATLVFYAAAFPRLARNTAHARTLLDKYEAGEISTEEFELEESMEKNRISNISTVIIILWVVPIRLTCITDSQQHWVHFHSVPKLIDSPSAGLQSQSQQLHPCADECLLGGAWRLVVYVQFLGAYLVRS
jgi:hypothetical protein